MKKVKEYIAARGEHTGHKHVFKSLDEKASIKLWQDIEDAIAEIEFEENAEFTHEEHSQILFVKGNKYKQLQMREIDPITKIIKKVID